MNGLEGEDMDGGGSNNVRCLFSGIGWLLLVTWMLANQPCWAF